MLLYEMFLQIDSYPGNLLHLLSEDRVEAWQTQVLLLAQLLGLLLIPTMLAESTRQVYIMERKLQNVVHLGELMAYIFSSRYLSFQLESMQGVEHLLDMIDIIFR